MFAQPKVECSVNAIYKVAKLKEEVAYTDFNHDVLRLYNAVKGNKPENIILKYDEKMGKDENERPIYRQFSMSLKEIGRKELCKTIRAVAATAACIFMRRNDVDSETILKIYCLGMNKPSLILSGRGDIFRNDSENKIICSTTPELIDELLK